MRTLAMIGCALALMHPAQAASLRCGGDLIQEGDSVIAVQDACGEPVREAAIVNDNGARVGTALYYRYDYGADRKVVLSGGKVTRVERLD